MKNKTCEFCGHSYDINDETEVRCVYHDTYPGKDESCNSWKERSNDVVNRDMALEAIVDAESVLLAFVAVKHLPSAI